MDVMFIFNFYEYFFGGLILREYILFVEYGYVYY